MILTIIYLLLVLALVGWKGWHAWLRGRSAYQQDIQYHGSLLEYMLGNGATDWQSRRPFLRHALQRAFIPMARQWRFWLALIGLGVLVLLVRSCS